MYIYIIVISKLSGRIFALTAILHYLLELLNLQGHLKEIILIVYILSGHH